MTGAKQPAGFRFDSHGDFYDFLDSNRGQANAGARIQHQQPPSSGSASSHAGLPSQHSKHRRQGSTVAQDLSPHSPGGRPPPNMNMNMNNNNMNMSGGPPSHNMPDRSQRANGSSSRARPPSYSDSASSKTEDMLTSKPDPAREQRQNARRSGRPAPQGPSHMAPAQRDSHPPPPQQQQQQQQQQPRQLQLPEDPDGPLPPVEPASMVGAASGIQRLKTPSVLNCVLQPLEQKVDEYAAIMDSKSETMSRLDDEIRALQQRRAETESLYLDAKAKHDEYRRQHQDVERAMRGELSAAAAAGAGAGASHQTTAQMQQQQQQLQQQQRPRSLHGEDDYSDDEDDLDDHGPSTYRRAASTQSISKASGKSKGRFRFSIFGGDR